MFKLLAKDHLGKPAIDGHGATIPKEIRLMVLSNPSFNYGSESYSYYDVTSIENYWNEAFDTIVDYDYLFLRDRIVELVHQKAYDSCLATVKDPATVSPSPGDCYLIGDNPVGLFTNLSGAIALWNGSEYQFFDPDVFGYNLCSTEEKEIAARLYIGLIPQHIGDFDKETTFKWRLEYHENATKTRYLRMRRAESFVEEELPQYADFIADGLFHKVRTLKAQGELIQVDFHKAFKDIGTKGSLEDRRPVTRPYGSMGVIDWFFARDTYKYDFSSEGLLAQDFQPLSGISLQQFCDRIYEILILGI